MGICRGQYLFGLFSDYLLVVCSDGSIRKSYMRIEIASICIYVEYTLTLNYLRVNMVILKRIWSLEFGFYSVQGLEQWNMFSRYQNNSVVLKYLIFFAVFCRASEFVPNKWTWTHYPSHIIEYSSRTVRGTTNHTLNRGYQTKNCWSKRRCHNQLACG